MAQQLTPAAWLERLEDRLNRRWFGRWSVFDAYYEGDHRLTFATQKFREAFGSLFGALADNWMPIVVDSSVERLDVQGFRFGSERDADQDAWSIWQANGLDAASDQVHTEAVKLGEAYWLVEPNGSDPPRITAEHPQQMIVAWAPGDRYERVAALKKWIGDDGVAYATLYLPNEIVKYESESKLNVGGMTGGRVNWRRRRDDPGGPNPLGEVPVVPVCNAPTMLRGGQSDLAPCIPLQNALNKLLTDMLIGSEYQAFPQRVLMGVDVPRDENGQPIRAAELKASQSRLWVFPNQDAKTAEFSAADLDNYGKAIQNLVQHLTAISRTPPHYIAGQIVNASGDALKAAETGLVSKVRQKMSPFGEAHEETMRLAFKALDRRDPRAEATDAETIWRDPESRSQAEVVDAVTKQVAIGLPFEIALEKIGYSPQEIDRIMAMKKTDDLLVAAQQPVVGVAQNGTPPPGTATAVQPNAFQPVKP